MPVVISGTNGITNATWTTATRPSAPSTGQQGYNSTLSAVEFYNGSAWVQGGGFTTQSVQTTGFTAVAGNIYPCNTTSAAFTVTLPASPIAGNQIQIIDYAGTFATNNVTLNPNGLKITGDTFNYLLRTNRLAVILTYIDATQGWVVSSAAYSTTPIIATAYTASYLIVAGGGGGGAGHAGGGGAGGLLSGTSLLLVGTTYSFVVGGGGAGGVYSGAVSVNGSNSTGLSLTAIGGGYGGGENQPSSGTNKNGASGGSGGGGANSTAGTGTGGSGTSGQGNAGGSGSGGANWAGGGGGGAGAVGANNPNANTGGAGGVGIASSITGSSVFYAGGGGGGGGASGGSQGAGGNGGGGSGTPQGGGAGGSGTANTGGGGGGGRDASGGAGGSGVVIISVPTAYYSGTTTGSPTITTSGSNTIIKFTASGSYTG